MATPLLIETATAAWLIIGLSVNPTHQGVDAVRFNSMRDCLVQLQTLIAETRTRPAAIITEPYCTDRKPSWWIDR